MPANHAARDAFRRQLYDWQSDKFGILVSEPIRLAIADKAASLAAELFAAEPPLPVPPEPLNIHDWTTRIIEGTCGMDAYERYEMVVWHTSERVAAANWTLRCLANPACEGSEAVLGAIQERRSLATPPAP